MNYRYSMSQDTASEALNFLRTLEQIRPKSDAVNGPSFLLLGRQAESGGIIPTGFSEGIDLTHMTHLNTALYQPLPDGSWTERQGQARFTAMLVLDDVGEKTSVIPQLEPTFKIRTKPGSEQWAFVYSELVDLEMGAGMATAAARAGLSDEFIEHRSHHWHRLHGSLPYPKQVERERAAAEQGIVADYSPACLISASWRTYTYWEVAQGLGLSPEPEAVSGYDGSTEFDAASGEQDPVLQWVKANGQLISTRPSVSGWHEVLCPNHAQHSSQTRRHGNYVPPNGLSKGAYKCFHSHCLDLNLSDYRRFIEEQGGPSVNASVAYAREVEPFTVPDIMPDAADAPIPDVILQQIEEMEHRRILEQYPLPGVVMPPDAPVEQENGPPSWQHSVVGEYIVGNNQQLIPCTYNASLHIRQHYAGCFAFDSFRNRPIVMQPLPNDYRVTEGYPRTLEDDDYLTMRSQLQFTNSMNGWARIAKGDVIDAVDAVCGLNRFHPVRDYLQNLPPVSSTILDTWLIDIMMCTGDAHYLRQIGRKWLIGAVARVMQPGCQMDNALILEGQQGVGKSTALRILAGDDWFGDSLPDFHDKAASEYLSGKWIIEMAELTGLRRSEVESMRSFLTRRSESFRPAYGRQLVNYKRQCVFAGSTNRDDYLTDPDGERRFWIANVGSPIDLQLLASVRDGLWKAAYDAYMSGEGWTLDNDVSNTASAIQRERIAEDTLQSDIEDALDGLTPTCVKQVKDLIALRQVYLNGTEMQQNLRISTILKSMGYSKIYRGNVGRYKNVSVWGKN